MNASERLRSAVDHELGRLRELCDQFDPRVLLLMAIRWLDWAALGMSRDAQMSAQIRYDAHQGVPRLLALLPAGCISTGGWPLAVSNPEIERDIHVLVTRAARIADCEYFVAIEKAGLGSVASTGDAVRIEIPNRTLNLERFDREDHETLMELVRRRDEGDERELQMMRPTIAKLTNELVGRWQNDFIRYEADPTLDDIFQRKGVLWCRNSMMYQDTFDGDATFGGIEFNTFRAVIAVLAGFSLKHLAFAQALLRRERDMRPMNLFTIVVEPSQLIDSLGELFDGEASEEEFAAVLKMLTWDATSDRDLAVAGEPVGLLQTIGEGFAIRSIAGCLDRPFFFLLRKLKKLYSTDWDTAVNRRERAFQQDIATLFPRTRFRVVDRSRILKTGGKPVTDIDAAVFDIESKSLALFQLKWQDPFGRSLPARQSRATNFIATGNDWVRRVERWLVDNSARDLQRALRLPIEDLREIKLFVLGRTQANFSSPDAHRPEAAWGNWPLFARLVGETQGFGDVLEVVHRRMRETMSERLGSNYPLASKRFALGELTVEFGNEGGPERPPGSCEDSPK